MRLIALDGTHGVLLTIGGTTLAKCLPNFENAGADPHDDDQQLRGHDHVHEREEREEDQRRQVLLAARGDEQHLVAQAQRDEQDDDGDDRRRGEQTVAGAPPGSASATTRAATSATYSATSYTVRSSPLVNGTLSGHGGSRIVPGRA